MRNPFFSRKSYTGPTFSTVAQSVSSTIVKANFLPAGHTIFDLPFNIYVLWFQFISDSAMGARASVGPRRDKSLFQVDHSLSFSTALRSSCERLQTMALNL